MLSKKAKLTDKQTFDFGKYKVICWVYNTPYSWGHYAELYENNSFIDDLKNTYYNRTWEAFKYESVINSLLNKCGIDKSELEKEESNNDFSSLAMVAKMGEFLTDTKEESNKWKTRMLKAGLSEIDFPEDWESLTEEEKETRLNKVISELTN